MQIIFTRKAAKAWVEAAEDLPSVTDQATNALALLANLMHGGDHDGNFGLADIAAPTPRALDADLVADDEALADLAKRLQQPRPEGGMR